MKIDTSQFENYSELSAEEKVALFENFEYTDHSDELAKTKKAFDKSASDLAQAKKDLKERMSAEELASKEKDDELERLRKENEGLMYEKNLGNATNRYLAMGYDSELAKSTAEAFLKGDMETFYGNMNTFNANREKDIEEKLMKGTGRPIGGGVGKPSITKEQFNKMDYSEMLKFKKDNPELYEEFRK